MKERDFVVDREVTDGAPAGYTQDGDGDHVTVQLASGETHYYWHGTYATGADGAGDRARFVFGSTYDVHPSGALIITGWRVWHEGWPAGTNDNNQIVATYGPGQWTRVSGMCSTDPWREEAHARRNDARNREQSRT